MNLSRSEKVVSDQVDRVIVRYAGGDEQMEFDNDVIEVELIEYYD